MAEPRFRITPPRIFPYVDWMLVAATALLCVAGLATLWGATSDGEGLNWPPGVYARRQAILMGGGWVVFAICALFDYRKLRGGVWWAYGALLLALAGLIVRNVATKGARSWYDLGFFNLQPSEPGKLIVIVALAHFLAARVDRFRGLRHLFLPALVVGAPWALILIQPDFGTAAVFIPTVAVMCWVAGLRKWVFVMFIVLGIVAMAAGYPHLKPYQKDRVITFLNPERDPRGKGYNVIQAQTTLGSGEFFGKGWGRGTQTQMRFLPEFHTDFIFPTVGEQFGLVGCLGVLCMFSLLIWRMVQAAALSKNPFGILVASGLTAMICTHIFMNAGMTIGLLPVTGLPLPFFSYGGSFLLTCMAALGLTVSVGARRELD